MARIENKIIPVNWKRSIILSSWSEGNLSEEPPNGPEEFYSLHPAARIQKNYTLWQNSLKSHIRTQMGLELYTAKKLKLSSKPKESLEEFKKRAEAAAIEDLEPELRAIEEKFYPEISELEETLTVLKKQLEYLKDHPPSMFMAAMGMFKARLPMGHPLIKESLGWSNDLDSRQIRKALGKFQTKLAKLTEKVEQKKKTTEFKYNTIEVTTSIVQAKKSDIDIILFGLCWI